jgi:predicted membrane-bound mannosyltransferase
MTRTTRVLAKFTYALFGTLFLVAGASTLLVKTGLLPDAIRDTVVGFSHNDLETLHIIQEYGTLLVLVGLLTFWFLRHYEQSQAFQWAMTAFWAIIALLHWFDVRGPFESVVGPLVNTVPFLLFLVIGVLRTVTEGRNISPPSNTLTP